MLNFIVLGYIPGTTIQLDFGMYMLLVGILTGLAYLIWRGYVRISHKRAKQVLYDLITRTAL